MERPDWHPYFLGIARAVAARADCTRRQVGAVIVDEDHRILATGYNGSPPGGPSCLKGECPRGLHYNAGHREGWLPRDYCACGKPWPCDNAVQPGSSYDTGAGECVSVHAEANALLFARASVKGATLYCTDSPCGGCSRLIQGAGITQVITPETLQELQGTERDPKLVEYNRSAAFNVRPVCERRGCGHTIGDHWDAKKLEYGKCRFTTCGCTGHL